MTEVISVKDLVMIYPDGTKAVDGVSFHVDYGEFFGFLGPNGAGKSTTIKILTTLLHKTSGEAKISGFDVEKNAGEIRKIVGLQAQETVIDWDLTGRENLVLEGNLHQMRGKPLRERVNELLKIVGLDEVADKRAAFYSGGMKKRLDLASVLVHRPKILFLDEPTTGLDPQSRAGIWDYLRQLNSDMGLTVYAKNGGYLIPDIVRSFDVAEIRVASLNVSTPTLDDVFLKHTGKRIRVEELVKQYGGMFGRRRR